MPSLYLADLLADEYEVYYALTNQVLTEIVEKNGYQAVMNSGFRVGYNMEPSYLVYKVSPTGPRRRTVRFRGG